MLLLSLQLIYGFIMGFAHIGYDNLHDIIPFNTTRAVHTNLLVVWLLSRFHGSCILYHSGRGRKRTCKVSNGHIFQLISLAIVELFIAIVGYHFNYWEGRKIFRNTGPLDWLSGAKCSNLLEASHSSDFI